MSKTSSKDRGAPKNFPKKGHTRRRKASWQIGEIAGICRRCFPFRGRSAFVRKKVDVPHLVRSIKSVAISLPASGQAAATSHLKSLDSSTINRDMRSSHRVAWCCSEVKLYNQRVGELATSTIPSTERTAQPASSKAAQRRRSEAAHRTRIPTR